MKRRAILVTLGLGLLLSLFACTPMLNNLERQLVYFPERHQWETPAAYGATFETLRLKTEDDVGLESWLIPGETPIWLIYFHGNANNISGSLLYPMHLQQSLGFNLIMAEYRGFYKSESTPSEMGLYSDAKAHYDYLINQGVKPKQIILYGFSLGSGVAVDLASKVEVKALILQAPYSSIPDAARWRYPWLKPLPLSLFKNQFTNKDKIAFIDAPLLILHGTTDSVVPFEQGQRLYGMAKEPKAFIRFEGNHTVLNTPRHSAFQDVTEQIKTFIQSP